MKSGYKKSLLLLLVAGLSACSDWILKPDVTRGYRGVLDSVTTEPATTATPSEAVQPAKSAQNLAKGNKESRVYPGTGRFVNIAPAAADKGPSTGEFTLNFDAIDVREVIKIILGDLLKANYVLDPAVAGSVSLNTARPLTKDMLLPTLETLLRMNNAALVEIDAVYHVVPQPKAIRGNLIPQLGDSHRALPPGYSLRIIPLRYIAASEMGKIIEPLATEGTVVRADTLRNLMVVAGTSRQIEGLLETVDIFDVNWMRGLSVGFFPVPHGNATEFADKLGSVLALEGEHSPLKGMMRIVPLENANAILVVTQQREYLEEIKLWMNRLRDTIEDNGKEKLFVYKVKNSDATTMADLITKIFSDGQGADKKTSPSTGKVAPGRQMGTMSNAQSKLPSMSDKGGTSAMSMGAGAVNQSPMADAAGAQNTAATLSSGVRVVADAMNNTLLFRATPSQYREIETALEELDILPRQVLIEATIVEVALVGQFKMGLQWLFKNHYGDKTGVSSWDGTLDGDSAGKTGIFPGFNWSLITSTDEVRAVLSAYAEDSLVNVLSSPSVMVLDNRTARMQVGDRVPVATQQQQSLTVDSRVLNSIAYQDTGIMLSVTPKINPGGLVMMDVQQEVSDVVKTTTSALDSPTIQTRNIASTVVVKNNQVIVLGGLIREKKSENQGGLPGLYKVPVLGWAFGQETKDTNRTELLVMINPKVVSSETDIDAVTRDFRNKVQGLKFTDKQPAP